MDQFVLFRGEVGKVLRKEHFGDDTLWMVQTLRVGIHQMWVPAKECIPLDPALNILFKEQNHD
jgi:hypothetical protein